MKADAAVGLAWSRIALLLAPVMLLVGVLLYPDVHTALMPAPLALAIVVGSAAAFVLVGRPRLMILLPVIAAFLPSRQAGFAAYLLALIYFVAEDGARRLVRPLDTIDRLLLALLVWSGVSWLANIGQQTDAWSLPVFILTFLSPWLLLFVARSSTWTRQDLSTVLAVWLALSAAQLIPAFVKPVVVGQLGAYTIPFSIFEVTGVAFLRSLAATEAYDLTSGTTDSAHHLGILLFLAVVFLIAVMVERRRAMLLLPLAVLYAFLMTDSKHVLAAAVPAGAVFIWKVVRPVVDSRVRRGVFVATLLVLAVAGPYMAVRAARIVRDGVWRPYVSLVSLNPKVQLYKRTTELIARNDLNTWIGYGPGSYATRAATIRASDVLYKEGNELPAFIPAHTGQAYRSVAYDLYTMEFADLVRFQSGVLSLPFSSIVGIAAEFGLLGTLLVVMFFGVLCKSAYDVWDDRQQAGVIRAAGATAGFAVPFLLVLGLFDSYLEQPAVTAPAIMLLTVALGARTLRPAAPSP